MTKRTGSGIPRNHSSTSGTRPEIFLRALALKVEIFIVFLLVDVLSLFAASMPAGSVTHRYLPNDIQAPLFALCQVWKIAGR
jgi:hypothetical protein